jgi:hypothetical protein
MSFGKFAACRAWPLAFAVRAPQGWRVPPSLTGTYTIGLGTGLSCFADHSLQRLDQRPLLAGQA